MQAERAWKMWYNLWHHSGERCDDELEQYQTATMSNDYIYLLYIWYLYIPFVYIDTLFDSDELIPRGSASTRTMHNHLTTKCKTIARMLRASHSSHGQDNFKCNKWSSFGSNELLRNNLLPDSDWGHSRGICQTQTLEVIEYTNLCGSGCAYGQWPTINVMRVVCEYCGSIDSSQSSLLRIGF